MALVDGTPALALLTHVLTPAMTRIGELWERNEITVADEHLATAITQGVMALVYPSLYDRPPLSAERILLACVEGDRHVLGLRMIADVLEGHGFEVIFLGPDLPLGALLASVERHQPQVVALGATAPSSGMTLLHTIDQLRSQRPDIAIIVGGRSVPEQLSDIGSGVEVVEDASRAISAVDRALERTQLANATACEAELP
ncbi:MAG: cobalamin-dependent protein [Actinomycetota bacterium]|nr:cobalamin-dependent protein [Actinomycetota bacterium]